jgi:hypothetical protein
LGSAQKSIEHSPSERAICRGSLICWAKNVGGQADRLFVERDVQAGFAA